MEQVKAQEVVLKDAMEDQEDKDKVSEALVKAGETLSLSPTSMEIHGPYIVWALTIVEMR